MSRNPKYLNLLKIRLPIMGMVSFGQRISGFILFFATPFSVYLLHLSVISAEGYAEVVALFDGVIARLILTVIAASIIHHLIAGIRFLLIDFDIGIEKDSAILGAKLVVIIDVLLIAALLYWIWF